VDRNVSVASLVRKPVRVPFPSAAGRKQTGAQISTGTTGALWQGASRRHGTGTYPGHGRQSSLRCTGPRQPATTGRIIRIVKVTLRQAFVVVLMQDTIGIAVEKNRSRV
jgi:hypothetical protein